MRIALVSLRTNQTHHILFSSFFISFIVHFFRHRVILFIGFSQLFSVRCALFDVELVLYFLFIFRLIRIVQVTD